GASCPWSRWHSLRLHGSHLNSKLMARKTHSGLIGVAALGSLLAASCCCLPVIPFLAAAGFAGGSAFLSAARPYLLTASVLLIGFGFYQAWREKKCERRPSVTGAALLWLSTVFVAISILFPQTMANAAADLL